MKKQTLMLIAALTLGGAVTANAATPAKPAAAPAAKKAHVSHHATIAKAKAVKQN